MLWVYTAVRGSTITTIHFSTGLALPRLQRGILHGFKLLCCFTTLTICYALPPPPPSLSLSRYLSQMFKGGLGVQRHTCVTCLLPSSEGPTPGAKGALRTIAHQQATVAAYRAELARGRGHKGSADLVLQQESMHPIDDHPLLIPCIGTRDRGVYSTIPPELLHAFDGGLLKAAAKAVAQLTAEHSGGRGTRLLNAAVHKMSKSLAHNSERNLFKLRSFYDISQVWSTVWQGAVYYLTCNVPIK